MMRKEAILVVVVVLSLVFGLSPLMNTAWAQGKKNARVDAATIKYTKLADICHDGKKSVGKIAEIAGMKLVDCFPETIQFHTNQQCATTVEMNPSSALYEKLKPYTFKDNLKVKFRISKTFIENKHLVGEFIAVVQE